MDMAETILYERIDRALENLKELYAKHGIKPSDDIIAQEAGTSARTLLIDKQRAFQMKRG